MSEKVSVAQVGCGEIGTLHLNSWIEISKALGRDVEIVAVCDTVKEKAQSAAALVKGRLGRRPLVYSDFRQMICQQGEINAIDVATIHSTHHVIAVESLDAGKHVVVEKPLAITVRAARQIIESARKSDSVFAVEENYRRLPRFRMVKHAVESGLIGEPRMIFYNEVFGDLRAGRARDEETTAWRLDKLNAGGGWLFDTGVHHADVFRYWLGEVEEVYGHTEIFEKTLYRRTHPESAFFQQGFQKIEPRVLQTMTPNVEDSAVATLKFRSGALGLWGISRSGHGETYEGSIIFGSKGCIKLGGWFSGTGMEVVTDEGGLVRERDIKEQYISSHPELFPMGLGAREGLHSYYDSITLSLLNFVEAVTEDKEPEVGGEEGLKDMAIPLAVLESDWLHQPVRVEDVESGKIRSYQEEIDRALEKA